MKCMDNDSFSYSVEGSKIALAQKVKLNRNVFQQK